jgi:hypothetical protein
MRPPFGLCDSIATAFSIRAALLTVASIGSIAKDRAAASTVGRKVIRGPALFLD